MKQYAHLIIIALALLIGLLAWKMDDWSPLLLFYLGHESNAEVQAFTAWVQWGLWIWSALTGVAAWWFKPDSASSAAPARSEWHVKSGRDSHIATDEGQVGGVRVKDSARVRDAVGGDKHETHHHHHHYPSPPAENQRLGDHHYGERSGVSALHQLPRPPADFTGREAELDELLGQMGAGGVTISAVQAMGGMGKTALALVLADRLRERYPDAQFFVPLAGASAQPLSSAQAMARVIHACRPGANLPQEEARLAAIYRSVLTGKRALLLLDDAANRKQVEALVPPAGCALLITSRQRFTLPGLHALNLNTLPPVDAEALLRRLAPRVGKHAKQLAKLCGYLPLALRVAGSLLKERPDLTLAEYMERLNDAQRRLALVEASISLSYDLLDDRSQERWRMLAVFESDFDRPAAAAVWQISEDEASDMLGVLLRYSLVQWLGMSESGEVVPATSSQAGHFAHNRYRLHDLARLFANTRLTDTERADTARRHAEHFLQVVWETHKLYKQGGQNLLRGLALFDREWPNIQAGQTWASTHAAEDDAAAALCDDYPDGGAHILHLRQHPREQIRWLEAALTAARRLKRRSAEGAHLANQGNAYKDLGEVRRAIHFYEQDLAIVREIGDRRGEGNALGSLGIAHYSLGEVRRAIEFYEQWLAIARKIGDRRGEGQALGNLGIAHYSLGEVRRAIEFYEQWLAIAREIGDRRGEGQALGNLGLAYSDLGEGRRAIHFYEQDLAIAREIGDRRGEGNALGSLGIAHYSLGEVPRAIDFYEQSLPIAREIGDRHGEGAVLGNLGLAYSDLGEVRRAGEFYEQHLAIAREIGDRRGEGTALWNMSLALDKLGEREKAIACAEASLVIREQIEDPRTAMVRKQLAAWRSRTMIWNYLTAPLAKVRQKLAAWRGQ